MSGFASQPEQYEIAGVKYMSTKLNGFQQLHVLRKLGPVIAKIGPAFMMAPPAVTTNADGSTTTNPATMSSMFDNISIMGPALEALSEMSEADCNYVIERCLAVTKRYQDPGGWVNIWNERAHRLQFDDIDNLNTMMSITMKVLGDSLTSFSFGGGLSFGAPPPPVQSAPPNSSSLPTVKIS